MAVLVFKLDHCPFRTRVLQYSFRDTLPSPMTSQDSFPDLFFAFPDGVLHHVCAECTAICCRGQGFAGNLNREMKFIFKTYPQLSSLVTEREKDVVTCATPAGRCFFLRNDNLCQIEVEHGRTKKPGICLLFPFNDFSRIGDTVVVAPHFMCPLRVNLPAAPGRVEGTHASIERALRETEMLEPGYVRGHIGKAALPAGRSAKDVLSRERGFRDLCGESLGRARFQEVLESCSSDPSSLAAFRKRVSRLLSWSKLSPNGSHGPDAMDDIFLAIGPAMRIEALYHTDEGLLRYLALAEMLARRVFVMSQGPVTPQGVYGVIEDMRPAIRLLAWADEAPALKKTSLKSPEFGNPTLVSSSQRFLNWIPSKGVLPALEKAFEPNFSAADRTVVVRQSADIVDPAIRRVQ